MLGWIRWSEGHRIRLEQERLFGVPLNTVYLPERAWGQERRIKKGARLLAEHRVTRVLASPGFEWWPTLVQQGLHPVGTQALRCALAPAWVEASLSAREIKSEQAVLLLKGARESPDMARVARALCPIVRNLVIDAPGSGELAARLRREYGLPVLPARSAKADLTLAFDSGPILTGAKYVLPEVSLPDDCEILPLLSALWECGRLKTEEIVLCV